MWQIQIIPKLWQILFLMLIVIISYIYSKKLIKRYKFNKSLIEFQNYKWRIIKDIFGRYHIDSFPYCIEHNKQIVWTKDSTRYCRCPDCDKPYSFEDIQKIYPEIKKHVRKEFNLFYLPDINYNC